MSETAATSRENAGVMERLKQLRLPLALVLALMASGMPGKANADGQANLKDTIGKLEEVKRTSDAEAAQARREAAQLQKEADEAKEEAIQIYMEAYKEAATKKGIPLTDSQARALAERRYSKR
jgi:hypothetical protein